MADELSVTRLPTAEAMAEWIEAEMATACIQCDQVHPVRLVDLDDGRREYWCTGCRQRRASYYPTR